MNTYILSLITVCCAAQGLFAREITIVNYNKHDMADVRPDLEIEKTSKLRGTIFYLKNNTIVPSTTFFDIPLAGESPLRERGVAPTVTKTSVPEDPNASVLKIFVPNGEGTPYLYVTRDENMDANKFKQMYKTLNDIAQIRHVYDSTGVWHTPMSSGYNSAVIPITQPTIYVMRWGWQLGLSNDQDFAREAAPHEALPLTKEEKDAL